MTNITDYPKFTLKDFISNEEKSFFQENGFIHYTNFITAETADNVARAIDSKQAELIQKGVQKLNGIPIKFGIDEKGVKTIQRFPYTSQSVPEVAELYNDARLKQLELFLPDTAYPKRIGLNEKDGVVANHYFNSSASGYKQLGWHTDVAREFVLGGKMYTMLNIGIYLTKSGLENGGLRALPGTHKDSPLYVLFRKTQILDVKEDPKEVLIAADPGDLCIHDGRVWHRVAPSPLEGEKSHRRVLYVAYLCGPADVRTTKSKTPFYHRFLGLAR
jgi:hypothetical protein